MKNISKLALIMLIASSITACNSSDSDCSDDVLGISKAFSSEATEGPADKGITTSEIETISYTIASYGCDIEAGSCKQEISVDNKKKLVELFDEYFSVVEDQEFPNDFYEITSNVKKLKSKLLDDIRNEKANSMYAKALANYEALGCKLSEDEVSCPSSSKVTTLTKMLNAALYLKEILNHIDTDDREGIQFALEQQRIEVISALNFYTDLGDLSYFYKIDADNNAIRIVRKAEQLDRAELVIIKEILKRLVIRSIKISDIDGLNYMITFQRELNSVKASLAK